MKKRLRKIIVAAIIFLIAVFIEKIHFINIDKNIISMIQIGLYVLSYLIVGFEVVKKAVVNMFHGEFFDENFLMSIATIGAFAIKEFPEAVAVMLFYQVGEYFQSYAVKKSRKSIASLMDIRCKTRRKSAFRWCGHNWNIYVRYSSINRRICAKRGKCK